MYNLLAIENQYRMILYHMETIAHLKYVPSSDLWAPTTNIPALRLFAQIYSEDAKAEDSV